MRRPANCSTRAECAWASVRTAAFTTSIAWNHAGFGAVSWQAELRAAFLSSLVAVKLVQKGDEPLGTTNKIVDSGTHGSWSMRCQQMRDPAPRWWANELEVPVIRRSAVAEHRGGINGALFHIQQPSNKGTTNLRSATPKVRVTTTTQQHQDAERKVMGLRRVRPQERLVGPQRINVARRAAADAAHVFA